MRARHVLAPDLGLWQPKRKPIAQRRIDWRNTITRGLVIACDFNDAGGRVVRNLTGLGPNGLIDPSASTPTWSATRFGKSLRFGSGGTGAADINYGISFGANTITGTTPRTAFLLTRRRDAQTNNMLVSLGTNATGQAWRLRYDATYQLRIEVEGGGFTGTTQTVANQVNALACVYTGGNLSSHTLYINKGSQAATGTTTLNTATNNNLLCGDPYGYPSSSCTDDLYLYLLFRRALSAAEIAALTDDPWQIFEQRYALWAVAPSGLVTKAGSDTLSVSLTESPTILSLLSRADTVSVALSEASQNLLSSTRSDTLTVSVSDAASITAALTGSDTLTVSISDVVSQLQAALTAADSLGLAVSESTPVILATLQRTDTLNLSLAEQQTSLGLLSRSDTLAVALTDATQTLAVIVTTSDALSLSIVEGTPLIGVLLTRADTLNVSLADASAILAQLSRSDTLSVSITDAAALLAALNRADTLTVGFTDASAILAQLSATDTLTLSIGDAAAVVTVEQLIGWLTAAISIKPAVDGAPGIRDAVSGSVTINGPN